MKRRLTNLLMACILALCMPAAALAAGPMTTIRATCNAPEIRVLVPSTGNMILNPRGLPVTIRGRMDTSQILCEPWGMENQSSVPISVNATVNATVYGDLELSDSSVKTDTSGNKRAFIFLIGQLADPGDDLAELSWTKTFNPDKHILITDDEVERENFLTLAPANEDGSTSERGVAAFCLSGDLTKKTDTPWNSTRDRVSVKIAFTFRPESYQAP